jgi:hypothetical protein
MTKEEMRTLWKMYMETDFLKFDRADSDIKRPDLRAFLLLNFLVPGDTDIVGWSRHEEITLSIAPDDLAKVVSEADIMLLVQCGVRYNHEDDCFEMFT